VFVPAEVRWRKDEHGGHRMGCRFLGGPGLDAFQNALDHKTTDAARYGAPVVVQAMLRLSRWGWIGLLGTLGYACLQWL
jgi:hypothetical protein